MSSTKSFNFLNHISHIYFCTCNVMSLLWAATGTLSNSMSMRHRLVDGRGEALDGVAAEVEFLTEEQADRLQAKQGGTRWDQLCTKASEQSRVWTWEEQSGAEKKKSGWESGTMRVLLGPAERKITHQKRQSRWLGFILTYSQTLVTKRLQKRPRKKLG